MEKQLSFEFNILSSGKQQYTSVRKHLSSKKEIEPKQENQRGQLVIELLPKVKEEFKLKALSLEGVKTEKNTLKETSPNGHSPKEEKLFENQIHLISVKLLRKCWV